jgi:hypothetical protein
MLCTVKLTVIGIPIALKLQISVTIRDIPILLQCVNAFAWFAWCDLFSWATSNGYTVNHTDIFYADMCTTRCHPISITCRAREFPITSVKCQLIFALKP